MLHSWRVERIGKWGREYWRRSMRGAGRATDGESCVGPRHCKADGIPRVRKATTREAPNDANEREFARGTLNDAWCIASIVVRSAAQDRVQPDRHLGRPMPPEICRCRELWVPPRSRKGRCAALHHGFVEGHVRGQDSPVIGIMTTYWIAFARWQPPSRVSTAAQGPLPGDPRVLYPRPGTSSKQNGTKIPLIHGSHGRSSCSPWASRRKCSR
jgi:hypothetical protein